MHEELQQLEAVGRLSGAVAHQFNNMLTVIQGHCDLLLEDVLVADTSRQSVQDIRLVSQRLASLTQQLLAFSGKQILQPRTVQLNDLVRVTEKLLQRTLPSSVQMVTILDPTAVPVRVDAAQMSQVVINLVANAADAMPQGGCVQIETAACDDGVTLTVSDAGHGMEAEVQERAFEPFFTTRDRATRLGMGLSTVYGVIHQSRGSVQIDSQPGQGTRVTLRLPAATAPIVERVAPTAVASVESATILVVDDEEVLRRLLCSNLKRFGYTVLAAENGEEALRLMQDYRGNLDLLIADMLMPGMNGAALAEKVTQMHPAAHVLFITGFTDEGIVERGELKPGVRLLQKPFSPADLRRTVGEILAAG